MKFLRTIFVFTFATVAIFFVFGFVNVNVVLASIDKIVFINDPQTIPVGQSSERYQVQLQNSSGGIEKAPDTTYFTLPLDLGQFSSAKDGTPFTATTKVYISTGDSNKYFFFKSDTAGTYSLKITATNKDGTKTWETEQTVVVGNSTTTTPDPEPTPVTPAATNTSPVIVTPVVTTVYSIHYIQEDLSDYEEPTTFEVGAGRGRLSYVNSPVSFEAKHKVSKNLSAKNCDYVWNFGDAVSLTGEKVEHIYKYAGDYNVVLNGTCGDLKSVARTAVKVLTPGVTLSLKPDGAVEIANQGKYEINLYNWKIQSGKTVFIFPQDTIISAGKSVTFAPEYLKLTDLNKGIVLVDASNKNVVQINANNLSLSATQEISVEDFQKFILAYQNIPTRQPITLLASTAPNPSSSDEGKGTTTPTFIPMTAAVADAIINNEENKPGFWGKIFHPIRTIKETFYE